MVSTAMNTVRATLKNARATDAAKMPQSKRKSTSRTTNKTLGRLRRSDRNERRVRGGRPQSREDALLLRE